MNNNYFSIFPFDLHREVLFYLDPLDLNNIKEITGFRLTYLSPYTYGIYHKLKLELYYARLANIFTDLKPRIISHNPWNEMLNQEVDEPMSDKTIIRNFQKTISIDTIDNYYQEGDKLMIELLCHDPSESVFVDAENAGTEESSKCTLFYTRGITYPMSMISQMTNGCDFYGIFYGKYKLINAMKSSVYEIHENKEFVKLKRVLGLYENVDYRIEANYQTLRYGKLIIFATDDDRGTTDLILNFFRCYFLFLLARNYVRILRTPTVREYLGGQQLKLYTRNQYEQSLMSVHE